MTPDEAKAYVAVLREKYPNPVSVMSPGYDMDCDYCVLGAASLNEGIGKRFPSPEGSGSVTLQKLNPALDFEAAWDWAHHITTANDDEMFEDAWRLLEEALYAKGRAADEHP